MCVCKQTNLLIFCVNNVMSIFFNKNLFFLSVLAINREVCHINFENIKKLLLGIKLMIISTIPSVIQKSKGIVESFQDVLSYHDYVTKIKSTSRVKINEFFIIVLNL